jgi:hypothetical protein
MQKRQDARGLIEDTRIGRINKGGKIGYSRQNSLLNSDRCGSLDAPCSVQTDAPCGGKIDHAQKWYSDQANRHF